MTRLPASSERIVSSSGNSTASLAPASRMARCVAPSNGALPASAPDSTRP